MSPLPLFSVVSHFHILDLVIKPRHFVIILTLANGVLVLSISLTLSNEDCSIVAIGGEYE